MSDVDEQVDRLLHDADKAGVLGASMAMDFEAMRRFREQRDSLIRMAKGLDPDRNSPAWEYFKEPTQ